MYIKQDTKLEDIDTNLIKHYIENDVDEDMYFDFKEGVDSSDPKEIHRIRTSLVSFANTFGGFLFLGILDKNKGKHSWDRLVGVKNTSELGKRITQKYLGKSLCVPLIDIEGPKVLKIRGKFIPVLKILRSEKRPHAIRKAVDTALEFYSRGSGTARPMEYSDLVSEFDKSRDERGWLNALYLDLEDVVSTSILNKNQKGKKDSLPIKYNSIIYKDFGSLLRVLGRDIELMKLIFPLKRKLLLADDARDYLSSQASLPLTNLEQIIIKGNDDMAERSEDIKPWAEKTMKFLFDHYPTVRELVSLAKLNS